MDLLDLDGGIDKPENKPSSNQIQQIDNTNDLLDLMEDNQPSQPI